MLDGEAGSTWLFPPLIEENILHLDRALRIGILRREFNSKSISELKYLQHAFATKSREFPAVARKNF